MKSPEKLSVPLEAGATTTALAYRPGDPVGAALILGHGAGADQRSRFMVAFADALSARGIGTVTFNFPYMEQRRRFPDPRPVLEACYVAVASAVQREMTGKDDLLFIGGKSMGGRIATHVAASRSDLSIAGLVLLGYPLHPPGRPLERRDAHLPDVRRPMLVIQGSRDTFGTPAELEPILARLSPAARLHVIAGGDHSFKVSRGGPSQDEVHTEVQRAIADWIQDIMREGSSR